MNSSNGSTNSPRRRTKNFATKIFLAQALSTIVISVVFTVFYLHHERNSMMSALITKGGLLVKQLADSSRIGVFAENASLLSEPIASVMKQKETLSTRIYNAKGRLLGDFSRPGTSKRQPVDTPLRGDDILKGTRDIGREFLYREGTVIEFWAPITSASLFSPGEALVYTDNPSQPQEQVIGYVNVNLDTRLRDAAFRTLLLNSVVICLAFLALALAIAYFSARSIAWPLLRLKQNVTALGAGRETARMSVESTDELGELAKAFNEMAESLKMREAEKEVLATQLQHAQKMEAIGQLAGGVAHDFNNILCAIIGFGTLIDMGMAKDDPTRHHLEQILAAADRATSLTQGLLAFSRKQAINPKHLDLNQLIRNVETMLHRLISEDIELRIRLSDRPLYVLVDSGQIDQVLLNLVTNARDAMPQGGVLTIETGETLANTEMVPVSELIPGTPHAVITVTDTGTGMEDDTRDKIFEPFFTTKEVGKGTGLGLSMAYGIIRQHNGNITVTSEPGKGTEFRIFLPLSVEGALPPHLAQPSSSTVSGTETVLVVEDNPEVRNLNRLVLETFGYHVIEAEDGVEAVSRFTEHQQDIALVLMDVVMPRMNGRQAFMEINRIRPGTRVLFMSGYAPDFMAEKGILTEEFNIINKPVAPMDLLRHVRGILDS